MKLCYIWVEDYRGFYNQGFNFSTEYTYSYDSSNRRLSRVKNEKYIPDFFGSGITEITGIIGKNASGKTNLLELVQYIIDGANTIINKPFIAIFELNGLQIFYETKVKPAANFNCEFLKYNGKIPSLNSVYFSNVFDGRRHNFGKSIINLSTNDLLNSQFGENINKNYQNNIQQQIRFINSEAFNLLEDSEKILNNNETNHLKPSRVKLTSPIWSNIKNKVKAFESKFNKDLKYDLNITDFVKTFRRKITDNQSSNSIKYLTAFLVYIDIIINRELLFSYKSVKDGEINDILDSVFSPLNKDLRIDEIYLFFKTEFATFIDQKWHLREVASFLRELDGYDSGIEKSANFREDYGLYSNRRIQFTLDYNRNTGKFLTSYLNSITNLNLSFNIEWDGISSGHKAYINLFSNFFSILSQSKEDYILICIDEGDLYFHPKWQTEFLFKLINIIPKLLKKPCQLILTTHSPFLVSDLPKDNLLFVDSGANGLRVKFKDEIEGETFGGNIGELYLDAFFMQGSLISHFAASKINSLVARIKNDKLQLKEEDKFLIDRIGDEIIKTQLINIQHDKN